MILLCSLNGIPNMPLFKSNSSVVGFLCVDFLPQSGISI